MTGMTSLALPTKRLTISLRISPASFPEPLIHRPHPTLGFGAATSAMPAAASQRQTGVWAAHMCFVRGVSVNMTTRAGRNGELIIGVDAPQRRVTKW